MEYLLLKQCDLPITNGVPVYEGEDAGGAPISLIFVDVPPGGGPRLHRHPYQEIFVIHNGQARFIIGTESIIAASGQVVIVGAGIPHKFVNIDHRRLQQTNIHLSPKLETEWLEL